MPDHKAKLFPVFRLRYKLFRQHLKSLRDYFLVRQQFTVHAWTTNAKVTLNSIFRPHKIILMFPARPSGGTVMLKLCALLGYTMTTNPRRPFAMAMKWKDITVYDGLDLRKIPASSACIANGANLDISKHTINRVFAEVFGYPLAVNPLEFSGPMVEKADENARHDGSIVPGPLNPAQLRPDRVYQKVIDNTVPGEDLVLDHRLPVFNGVIPLVYFKYRPVSKRFTNRNQNVKLGVPEAVFSPSELGKIISMAKILGLDYGEMDVLRDKDGRIYVVDVNNTPHGPPNGLPKAEGKIALEKMAAAFAQMTEAFSFKNGRS